MNFDSLYCYFLPWLLLLGLTLCWIEVKEGILVMFQILARRLSTFHCWVLHWLWFCDLSFLVYKSCPTLCDPVNCSIPGFPLLHYLLEFVQTHVHWVVDAIQPSHLLLPSSFVFNHSQLQGLFQWVDSSHQVAKVLELQLQPQSFQWIFRVDFL